jgi:deazaflavin-dependent oxidoreductase (nitroreductase family)
MTGLPVVWLTTRGAKSGKYRTLPLVGIPEDTGLILVASSFGKERHPGWYYNVRANPGVVLSFNGSTFRCIAREVEQPEYAILWSKAVSMYPGYAGYKERAAGRQIPLFYLTQSDEAEPEIEAADII